ncbi:MAG: TldD/PmbA family protein [Anaerolineales bacterium]|nr:TldD/PmbA family protein [Anaerolineales bacterium]
MSEIGLRKEMAALRPSLPALVQAIEAKAPYGAVYLTSKMGQQISVDNVQEKVSESSPTAGTVLSAFDGVTMRERAVGGFILDEVQSGLKDLLGTGGFSSNGGIDPGLERSGDFKTAFKIDPSSMSTEEKLAHLRELNRRVNAMDEHIVNVRVNYSEYREQDVFCSRTADLGQHLLRVVIMVLVIVAGESGVRFDYGIKYATGGWEALEFTDEELQKVVSNAVKLLTAERIEPGEYTIITGPPVSGVICHESFGHGVETDMFLKERARASAYIDKVVGSPLVDIYDDASIPGAFGSYFFDHEGVLARPTQIVEKGIFRRGITDLYSATRLGIERTPNGRRQDFSRKIYPRMSNTYFGPGESSLEEMLAQVDHGIYLGKVSSGMEDPKGWGIQVSSPYAFEIKNGELTDHMYGEVGITGYVPEVFQSISAVGKTLHFDGGTCGKGHKETVKVSSGGPHMLLKARLG